MGQVYRMTEEVGFLRHKPGGGRGGKRAPPRSPRRAHDPSHRAVTREVLDVARCITDVTAQLEALAMSSAKQINFSRNAGSLISRNAFIKRTPSLGSAASDSRKLLMCSSRLL